MNGQNDWLAQLLRSRQYDPEGKVQSEPIGTPAGSGGAAAAPSTTGADIPPTEDRMQEMDRLSKTIKSKEASNKDMAHIQSGKNYPRGDVLAWLKDLVI